MTGVLGLITILAYLFGAFAFVVATTGSDIQYIVAGIYFTCGTVAFAAICIINAIDKTKRSAELMQEELP